MNKTVVLTSLLLCACLVLFETTGLDLLIQDRFFDFNTGLWLVDQNQPVLKWLLYDGFKQVLIALVLGLFFILVFFRHRPFLQPWRQGLIIVCLSAVIVPVTVASLKAITNVPCPKHLEHYGGTYPHVTVFSSYPDDFRQQKRIKCFPAGHASGAFSLLSLYFLFRRRHHRIIAVVTVVTLGWLTGGYKMLIGDHFMSHTLVTLLLAIIEINLIAQLVQSGTGNVCPRLRHIKSWLSARKIEQN